METPELEKIIKKLEEVDIYRWKYVYEPSFSRYFLFVETNGLRFSIAKGSFEYSMFIENVEDEISNNWGLIKHTFDKKNKPQRELLDKFYEKKLASLKEYKEKEIKEKFNSFLSE